MHGLQLTWWNLIEDIAHFTDSNGDNYYYKRGEIRDKRSQDNYPFFLKHGNRDVPSTIFETEKDLVAFLQKSHLDYLSEPIL
ncbi:hypothetical protein KW791_03190 [Candidatus Parcubacteria bacterium]|nr:hypothetical protein [Candidatus Parcubacteria bacterium]